jgi:hypothetical protein
MKIIKRKKIEKDMGFQSKEGLMFGDGHVETICYLELKIIGHCFFASRIQRGFVKLQLAYS